MTRSLTALFVLIGLLAAAPADATLLVKSDSTGLLVQDKNGLGDRVEIVATTQNGNPVYVVFNNNAFDIFKFDRQAGCSAGSTDNRVVCQKISTKLNLAMAGGDDRVDVASSGAASASVNLGTGDDEYDGVSGPDNVFATTGDDTVRTGAGNDDINPGTESGGFDSINAGAGNDSITEGGPSSGHLAAQGGDGDDEIVLFSGSTKDVQVLAGSGNDRIVTGEGDDEIFAGLGEDTVSSGKGADEIAVREDSNPSFRDTVNCGFGQDGVFADLKDSVSLVTNPRGGTCEEVDRAPVGETPHVKLPAARLRVSASGIVRARLRCPRGVRRLGCKGSLQLAVARAARRSADVSRSRKVRYRIRAARSRTVAVKLSRRDLRALRSRRGRRGVLVSVEAGRIGLKTTVRNPRLVRR